MTRQRYAAVALCVVAAVLFFYHLVVGARVLVAGDIREGRTPIVTFALRVNQDTPPWIELVIDPDTQYFEPYDLNGRKIEGWWVYTGIFQRNPANSYAPLFGGFLPIVLILASGYLLLADKPKIVEGAEEQI